MGSIEIKSIIVTPKNAQQKLLIETFLKALKLESREYEEPIKMSKEEFVKKLKKSKSESGTILKTPNDVDAFFELL